MEVASTSAEGIVVGRRLQGSLLEPCLGWPLPGVQLDLMAADIMLGVVCAVEGVSTGTRREVTWQLLQTCDASQLGGTAMHRDMATAFKRCNARASHATGHTSCTGRCKLLRDRMSSFAIISGHCIVTLTIVHASSNPHYLQGHLMQVSRVGHRQERYLGQSSCQQSTWLSRWCEALSVQYAGWRPAACL